MTTPTLDDLIDAVNPDECATPEESYTLATRNARAIRAALVELRERTARFDAALNQALNEGDGTYKP